MKNCILGALMLISFWSQAQEHAWVYFTDKPNVQTAINNPSTILSPRAIARKNLHQTTIDARDVPVNETYISSIKNQTGITVKAKSKWFNCVHVLGSIQQINNLTNLSFVQDIVFANDMLNAKSNQNQDEAIFNQKFEVNANYSYGASSNQITMMQVENLHQNDFTGSGMLVAVLDSGFPNVLSNPGFADLNQDNRLLGGYDFVARSTNFADPNSHNHGAKVLSDMVGFLNNQFVGTSPEASFYLFRTEDAYAETPLEETYWVEAAERADSLGVDLINSSLGYYTFDNPDYNYTPQNMDGNTTFITKGANIAVEKGILVVNAAGNTGQDASFPIINAPADGNVLSIGAVDQNGDYASFSSVGPSADGRVKPDVAAQGAGAAIIDPDGSVTFSNGTSFAAPIMTGAIASLWQANPQKTNLEIMQIVRESASRYNNPNTEIGYGIPNFSVALQEVLSIDEHQKNTTIAYPNPTTNNLYLSYASAEANTLRMYNLLGEKVLESKNTKHIDMTPFAKGMYLLHITKGSQEQTLKIIKE
ncbi:S8 family serine peptidase [Mesonia sp. MT50]|uniref:S8 family serine peptidase n=1 Tax=Mesonia profundi TaxID=3070998 RepID=A0ABU1A2B6_9FLAO|nr:S8 family serine peptidase [Mesonia profundi]MDQ7916841.1 S8 family serine peptidase [Mesonia profundi]